jgi:hypothetical protein
VHLAERFQNFAAKIGDRFAVGHVNGVSQSGFGFLLIQLIGSFLSVFHRAANDGNSGAFSGEPLGDCLPYSSAGAGNNRDLINKTIHDDRLKADVGRWSRIKVREFRRSVRRKDPCAKLGELFGKPAELLLIRPQQIDSLTALRKMPDERSHTVRSGS